MHFLTRASRPPLFQGPARSPWQTNPGPLLCRLAEVLLGLCLGLSGSLVLATTVDTRSIDAELGALAMAGPLPGFAVGIVKAEGLVYLKAFGYADRDKGLPYTPRTLQAIASVSKTFVGLSLALAHQEGLLELDAPLTSIAGLRLQNPYHPKTPLTLRHLATHTSSLRDEEARYEAAYVRGAHATQSLAAFLASYLTEGTEGAPRRGAYNRSKPGTRYEYSNLGAATAALALEAAVGEDFASYTQRRLLEPLGMKDSSWRHDPNKADRRATLYSSKGTVVPTYVLLTYPDGGLTSTCEDLSLYLLEMLRGYQGRGKLLSAEAYAELFRGNFTPGATPEGLSEREPNCGLFWHHSAAGGLGHTGADPGVGALLAFNPKTGFGRVFLTNGSIDEDPKATKQMQTIWKKLETWYLQTQLDPKGSQAEGYPTARSQTVVTAKDVDLLYSSNPGK